MFEKLKSDMLKIYNVGYNVNIKNTKTNNIYILWSSILFRCYSESYLKRRPTYIGCSVDKRWHDFQVFAEWYNENYIDGFHLDKDILFKGNKIYGPDTCCFVPLEINNLFTNSNSTRGKYPIGIQFIKNKYVAKLKKFGRQQYLGSFDTIEQAFNMYKINKEFYIQQIANKWKNQIPENVYQAMYNYQVEITD